MYSQCWLIIRDDSRKTFEVCGKESNTDHFDNQVHGMQKAGMAVSAMTQPVTGKSANKDAFKFAGYTREDGLHVRLLNEYARLTRQAFDEWGSE